METHGWMFRSRMSPLVEQAQQTLLTTHTSFLSLPMLAQLDPLVLKARQVLLVIPDLPGTPDLLAHKESKEILDRKEQLDLLALLVPKEKLGRLATQGRLAIPDLQERKVIQDPQDTPDQQAILDLLATLVQPATPDQLDTQVQPDTPAQPDTRVRREQLVQLVTRARKEILDLQAQLVIQDLLDTLDRKVPPGTLDQ